VLYSGYCNREYNILSVVRTMFIIIIIIIILYMSDLATVRRSRVSVCGCDKFPQRTCQTTNGTCARRGLRLFCHIIRILYGTLYLRCSHVVDFFLSTIIDGYDHIIMHTYCTSWPPGRAAHTLPRVQK